MTNLSPVLLFSFVGLIFAGCSGTERQTDSGVPPVDSGSIDTGTSIDSGLADAGSQDAAPPDTGPPPAFELSTTAFAQDDVIPLRYECGGIINGPGENISPELAWTEGPPETMSYAIIMDDVDSGVVHWVVYDIPPDALAIAEDVPSGYELAMPAGAKQAEIQGTGYFGYFGPCSPNSVNTYRWTIHAIPSATLMNATRQTTEYEMVTLIQAQSIASSSFSGES